MAIIDYILGFMVALFRIVGALFVTLFSILKMIIETPLACHYFGRLCVELKKTPWQLTQEEINSAYCTHAELDEDEKE